MTQFLTLFALLYSRVLSVLVPFSKETSRLPPLRSHRLKEAKVLVRLECGFPNGYVLLKLVVLVPACIPQNYWVRECEGLGAKRETIEKKRSMRIAKMHEYRWPMQLRSLRSDPRVG